MSWLNQPYQGGYPQQPPPFNPALQPQQTGYPGQPGGYPQQPQQQQPPQFQQQQPTGYGGLRPQPTGYAPMQQRPMPTGYAPQQFQSSLAPTGYAPPPPLLSNQSTGYPTQRPGFAQPAIQNQFVSTFMPAANVQPTPYMDPSRMQFAAPQQGPSLQQSFQQSNEQATGQATVPIPWALTADEKKRYDQIFRAWDQQGAGFIGGDVSKEVFGQAGLERDDLMDIWNLADVTDRGKLNIDEFHVAMGLIYRRLNGNPIPKTLPPELAPPSSRDLNDSVGFLKNLLKHDTNARATTNDGYNAQGSYAKQRSLHENAPQPNRKDATVYRHNDAAEATTYKSSSRHIDRDAVRYAGNDSPTSDLDDVKKSLQNTRSLVENSREREEEEEELKDNLRDLKRRIERVHDDLEYNLRSGRRTPAKDDEKRKLERELLKLEHEELPSLSKKMEEKAKEIKRGRAKFALERDQRNNNYDRFDDRRGGSDRSDSRDDYDSRADRRGYNRGTYDEDEGRSSNRRNYERTDSPPRASRTPPPPPPPVPIIKAPPPPPVAKSTPLAPPAPSPSPSLSSMTAEERTAHIRAAATQRLADRARALGLVAPSSSIADTSIADRLEQDRQEAAARVAEADRVLAAKEVERQAKLEKERLRSVAVEKSIQESAPKSTPAPAKKAAVKTVDPEEAAIAEQEATMLKEKAARQARLKQLEKELEEAKEAEDNFIKNKAKFAASAKATARAPPPPPSRSRAPPAAPVSKVVAPPPVAEALPPPPAPTPVVPTPSPVESLQSPVIAKTGSTNPFHRLGGNPAAASPAAVVPPSNPFFRIGAAAAAGVGGALAAIPVVGSLVANDTATPAAAKPRPPPASDDDWDVPKEKDDDDSSSDEDEEGGIGNRHARQGLASALFGGIIAAPARPTSAQAATPPPPSTDSPASAPRTNFPPPPTNDEPVVRPMALLGQIAGGFSLKKTQTKDRSTPASAGAVIGDASAPVQHYQPPSPPRIATPPAAPIAAAPVENGNREKNNRDSVDWYGTMAADGAPSPVAPTLPAQVEEEEPEEVAAPVVAEEDPLDAVDLSITQRSRSLYAYEGQRPEDLSFEENVVILAHPAKDASSPWWYGSLAASGQKGWFPASYIESIDQAQSATALYDYDATSAEEVSFKEGSVLSIVDSSEVDWWKAEKDGKIGLVPATYLELQHLNHLPKSASASSVPTNRNRLPSLEILPRSPAPIPLPPVDVNSDDDDESTDEEGGEVMNPAQREKEKLRVLAAAGLLIKVGSPVKSSPRRPRRSPPKRPTLPLPSTSDGGLLSPTGDATEETTGDDSSIPQPPEYSEEGQVERTEDAYDIWQRVMRELPPLPPPQSLDLTMPTSPLLQSPSLTQSPTPSTISKFEHRPSATGAFFSRVAAGISRTSSVGDKARPIVSSPMLSASSSVNTVGDRRSIVGLGSTWSSLIDPTALEGMPDRERKRQEAIFEFIFTESTFLQNLQLVMENFFPVIAPLLSTKALSVIFANLEEILLFSVFFLSELEERQRVSRLYVDQIGDVVLGRIQGIEVFRGYCVNQSNAARTLADLKQGDTRLRATLDSLRIKGLELEHFLLEPMQRLARYALLISQILRYTEADHPDFVPLTQALKVSESILVATNEAIRALENAEKLVALSENLEFDGVEGRLDLTASTRLLGPRLILKEGELFKLKSGRKLNAILFNDLILCTETRSGGREIIYRYPIPLEECSVRAHRDDISFQITHRGASVNLRASTPRQALTWRREIEAAREVCLAAVQGRKVRGSLSRTTTKE